MYKRQVLDKDGKPVTETVEVTRPAFKVVSVFDVDVYKRQDADCVDFF